MSAISRWRAGAVAAYVAAVCILVVQIVVAWPFTADDSFITFRYARNLAAAHGPTFNPGQPPVEGYTSVLWLLVMLVPHALGGNPVLFAKLTGIACIGGSALMTVVWSNQLARRAAPEGAEYAGPFAAFAMASFGAPAVHAVSGMETALAGLCFGGFLYGTHRCAARPSRAALAATALLALGSSLARPELTVGVIIALATLCLVTQPSGWGDVVWIGATAYMVPLGLYEAWRVWYYGEWLPLPYYVKVSPSTFAGAAETLRFIAFVAVHCGIFVALAVVRLERALLPAVAGTLSVIAVLVRPSHIMGYEWRYFFPLLPGILAIAASGVASLYSLLAKHHSVRVARATAIGACIAAVAWLLADASDRLVSARDYGQRLTAAHVALGMELARVPVRGSLALADAGAVPYYSGWQTLDTYGLNDVTIAKSRRHNPSYILSPSPDVLVLISSVCEEFRPLLSWEGDLYGAAAAHGFDTAARLVFDRQYYLWVMTNRESQAGRLVAASIGNMSSCSIS